VKLTNLFASLCVAVAAFVAAPANAQVVINEVLYRTSGVDTDVFVELKGPAGTSLTGFRLNGINGNGGTTYGTINLSGSIPSDGLFVVTRTDASAALAAVSDLENDLVDYQNGPDSIQLRNAANTVIDAVGYGVFTATEVFAGEGSAAPDAPDDQSLARNAAGSDTGNNANDFSLAAAPTPGAANGGGGGTDGSCAGVCGDASPDGSCFCDESCASFGDCCADVCDECSELESCGGPPPGCTDDGDCAAGETCNTATGACEAPITGSCAGACGAEGSGNCFCDESCFAFGDCCEDVCDVCSADLDGCGDPPPPPPEEECVVDGDCVGTDICVANTCVPAAATGYDVTVDSVDASGFPTVNMIVSVRDAAGNFVDDLTGANFLNLEDGAPMEDCSVSLLSEGGTGAKADIVFVFDTTGSMGEEIEGLRVNTLAFADTLTTSGIDFRLGLVSFGDTVVNTFDMTADANEFRGVVQSLVADGGGDEPENPLDAIREATTALSLRPEAAKIFILVTDATFNTVGTTMTQAIELTQAANAQMHVVTSPSLNSLYDPIVAATGGQFFDILAANFSTVLDGITEVITARYAVSCTTPRPVRDNTTRDIVVQINDGALGGQGTGEYFVGGGSLIVSPTFTVAAVGTRFKVDIVANGVTDLQNAHISLAFDTSYLEFIDATPGELLGRDTADGDPVGEPIQLFDPSHDPDAGRIGVAVARQSNDGTDGSGVVVTLEFEVTAASPPDLTGGVEDNTLADDLVFQLGANGVFLESSANREIVVVDVQNGDVDSTQGFLLGDFDEDGDIDIVDFNTLVSNFGSTDATLTGPTGGDIGPADGDPPNMTPSPDGIVDHRDLFVFTRMFNWFRFERE
jgi:hypothetical protein